PSYATPSWHCDKMMTLAHGSRSHRPDSTRDPKGELWDRATCDRLAWFSGDHARESATGLLGHPPGHPVAAGGRARSLHRQRRDGEGADCKSFLGRDFVLLLDRRAARSEWQLQAAVREGRGARFWYEPGEYEVKLMVSAENALRDQVVSGVLRVGPELDDVKF